MLVGATRTLPRAILDRLEPWDLPNLVPYNESYLSGFQSEIYQVDLDEGFEQARGIMDSRIYHAILSDIGGDQQRVNSLETQHAATTFKHVLLPVWSAAFRYNGETYRFVINGRNGKTQGERPYSVVKIVFAALLGISLLGGLGYFMDKAGVFEQMMQQGGNYQQYQQYQPRQRLPDPYRSNPGYYYR